MAEAAPKRSARQRQGTSKVRVFDEHTRKEIKRKRLDSLENDNWQEERQKLEDEEDDDYNPLDDGDESGDGVHARARILCSPRTARPGALSCSLLFFSRDYSVCPSRECMRTHATHASRRSIARAEVKVDSKRSTKKKKPKKKDIWNATQKCKTLQEVLDEAEYHKYPSWMPNYTSIAAAPSRYPPRRFCSVSGLARRMVCSLAVR